MSKAAPSGGGGGGGARGGGCARVPSLDNHVPRTIGVIDLTRRRHFACEPAQQVETLAQGTGAGMTKTIVGIIGGSGVYERPGLEDIREEWIATPWAGPSDELHFGR